MAVVAQQMAEFSIQYLAYQMGVPPEAFEPFRPQLVETLRFGHGHRGRDSCEPGRGLHG